MAYWAKEAVAGTSILLRANAGGRDLEEAVWAVVGGHFNGDAAIAANRVTFFTEKKCVQGMEAKCRRR